MGKTYKSVIKHKRLLNFLLQTNDLENIQRLKYKTIEKTSEYVHHYGWYNIHLYSVGIYQLNNGKKICFDYSYEMDPKNIKNIKIVIFSNFSKQKD